MAQLFETLCMMLAFKESHSLAMHYCRLVWDVRSLSNLEKKPGTAPSVPGFFSLNQYIFPLPLKNILLYLLAA